VTAQTIGADGYVWYQLEDGSFVRSDVVTTAGVCGDLPGADVTAPPPPTVTSEAVATPTPAVAEPTTPPDTGGGEVVTVEIQDFQFSPNNITIPVGTTVRFVSVGQVQHTVTSDSGLFDSGILTNGQEFSFTFTEAGTFPYFCQLHGAAGGGGMAGTIVVEAAPSSGTSGEPVTVEIQDFQFAPNSITVPVGTTVRFVSVGQVQHTVTSDSGLYDSGILTNGQEFSFTFTEAGTFPYFCQLHGAAGGGGMAGTVIVQ
jgi:plastocyanin